MRFVRCAVGEPMAPRHLAAIPSQAGVGMHLASNAVATAKSMWDAAAAWMVDVLPSRAVKFKAAEKHKHRR